MGLTLKEAKKFLKVYKKAYRLILKMYRWCIIPLSAPLEQKLYIEKQIAYYTEYIKTLKEEKTISEI